MEIEIKIIKGIDLIIKDIKTSDPYVKFKINGMKYKTKTIMCTLYPEWNESFTVTVNEGDEITFEIWDFDTMKTNDHMGNCQWIVPSLINGQEEYFILKNQMQGYLLISAKSKTGGYDPISLPYCDITKETVLQINIEDGHFWNYELSNKFMEYDTLQMEMTSYNYTYVQDVTAFIKKFLITSTLKEKPTPIFYVKGIVGEEITITIKGKKPKKEYENIIQTVFYIPDCFEEEKYREELKFQKDLTLGGIITCLQSVYRNVAEDSLPDEIKQKQIVSYYPSVRVYWLDVVGELEDMNIQLNSIEVKFSLGDDEYAFVLEKEDESLPEFNNNIKFNPENKIVYVGNKTYKVTVTISAVYEGNPNDIVTYEAGCVLETVNPMIMSLSKEISRGDGTKIGKFGFTFERQILPHFQEMYWKEYGIPKDDYVVPTIEA